MASRRCNVWIGARRGQVSGSVGRPACRSKKCLKPETAVRNVETKVEKTQDTYRREGEVSGY